MRQIKTLWLTLVVAFAAVATAATAAQAAEGPFYKIAGARLGAAESKEVTSKLYSSAVDIKLGTVTIECTKQGFAAGAKLTGSSGANSGAGTATLEFSGCSVRGNGEECAVSGKTIETKPLKLRLAYSTSSRSGALLMNAEPASGTIWAKLEFTGAHCQIDGLTLVGSLAAELFSPAETLDEVGKEPAEATRNLLRPNGGIAKVWVEEGGTLVQKESGVRGFGAPLNFAGEFQLELAAAVAWGVYTK